MEATILFRPSELSNIMGSARGKSNAEKYDEIEQKQSKYIIEYGELKNRETKKAQELQRKIKKTAEDLAELEPVRYLPNLSEGTKKHLRKKMIEIKYSRYQDIETKYMTKGKKREEAAIDFYSILKGRIFENNKIRVQNEYYTGEIDLPWYTGERVMEAITDIKNSWDIFTFWNNEDDIKSNNRWQGIGYMDIHPTVEKYHIANILLNNTPDAILNELYREGYKWPDGDTPAWRELQVIKGHIYTQEAFDNFITLRFYGQLDEKAQKMYDSFVEIPAEERIIEHTFTREEVAEDIQRARTRIDECRIYMEMVYGIKHIAA